MSGNKEYFFRRIKVNILLYETNWTARAQYEEDQSIIFDSKKETLHSQSNRVFSNI